MTLLCIFLVTLVLRKDSPGQDHRRGFPSPPGPAVSPNEPTHQTKKYERLDTVTMEREAQELSALAGSIPYDVEQIKKGLLPKDVVDKLRRIEKLSKQLRGQVHQ
jgi:hypothetical protein